MNKKPHMKVNYKHCPPTLVVSATLVIKDRVEINAAQQELHAEIPKGQIIGPPFSIFHFISSVKEGSEVTVGYPISNKFESANTHIGWLPEMEVLSIFHRDGPDRIGNTIGSVFAYANRYGIISDELYREVYFDEIHPDGPGIEIHFIIHNWDKRLRKNLERVLDHKSCTNIMQGSDELGIETQKFDILSSCAHVFPSRQIDKLTTVFNEVKTQTGDGLLAVDAVISFMNTDPGWAAGGNRDGFTIISSKKPRDPKAHAEALTDMERKRATCYCPLVRSKLDQGMPVDFCKCGSGWFRQQWEGATGKPVMVEVLKSVLRGDEYCEFAIHLSEDL